MTAPGMPTREVPAGLTAEQAAVVASQAAYEAQQEQLRQQLVAALIAIWAGVAAASNFSPAAAAKFVASILPISIGAQRAMAAITTAQMNQLVRPPTPIIIAPDTVSGPALRGVDPEEYYERPFREIKWRLSQGKTLGEAVEAGRRRAESIVRTDLQLAHTHTARQYAQQQRARPREQRGPNGTIVGYRRVLSNRPNHCALCIIASTQRYHVNNLMPIHPNCGCTVGLVMSTDPRAGERVIDPSLLQQVHNVVEQDLGEKYVDAGGRQGMAHYRDIIIVNEHGELGPVLGVRGQHFERDPNRPGRLGHIRVNPLVDEQADADAVQDLDEL